MFLSVRSLSRSDLPPDGTFGLGVALFEHALDAIGRAGPALLDASPITCVDLREPTPPREDGLR